MFHAIISNHAFVDGNKRTATLTAVFYLFARGELPEFPSQLQIRMLGEVAIATASTRTSVDDVARWFHRILDPD